MIDFGNLTRQELADNGLAFATAEEANLFAQIILDELACRIGKAIAESVGPEKTKELDLCASQEEMTAWLEKNCPEYRRIVPDEKDKLNREIMEYRDRIPGVLCSAPEEQEEPEEFLELEASDDEDIEEIEEILRELDKNQS